MVGILLGGLLFMTGAMLDFGRVLHVEGWDLQAAGVLSMAVGLIGVLLPPLFRSPWGHPRPEDEAPYEGIGFINDELVDEDLTLTDRRFG